MFVWMCTDVCVMFRCCMGDVGGYKEVNVVCGRGRTLTTALIPEIVTCRCQVCSDTRRVRKYCKQSFTITWKTDKPLAFIFELLFFNVIVIALLGWITSLLFQIMCYYREVLKRKPLKITLPPPPAIKDHCSRPGNAELRVLRSL